MVRILMFCLQGTDEGRIRMKATFIYELSRAAVLFYFYKERNRWSPKQPVLLFLLI